eukprot:m.134346 g.134346  ORF g.134346 m.134346 type:complete len:158 (+) comp22528_c0_seq13:40-513(+)
MGDASPEEEVMYHDLARYTAEDAYKLLIGAKFLEQSDDVEFLAGLAELYRTQETVTLDDLIDLGNATLGEPCGQCETHHGGADPSASGWLDVPGVGLCCPACQPPKHTSIDTITLTFGEVAENHVGMQKVGEIAEDGCLRSLVTAQGCGRSKVHSHT